MSPVTVSDHEARPIRCPGCGARLADRLGDLVVVRLRVRAGQSKRVVAREVEITCLCGVTRRPPVAP